MRRLLILTGFLLLVLAPVAEAKPVKLYFLQAERLTSVTRDLGDGATPAIQALLAGPTTAERKAGYGTVIPSGVTLTSVNVDDDKATVELSANFATADVTYLARVAQVVYTVTLAAGVDEVEVRGRTFTRDDFAAPDEYVAPKPPSAKLPRVRNARAVQERLAELTYLPEDAVNGKFDYRTQQAVLAFQSWEGLERDGVVGPMTRARLEDAGRPRPMTRSRARQLEIYRDRGVVLLIEGARTVRVIHTSTGIGQNSTDTGTPPGRFKIYRKEQRSWSIPYKTWLPFAAYWNAGWAVHGYGDVPAFPASHGCARVPMPEAQLVYDFVSIGTPVRVI